MAKNYRGDTLPVIVSYEGYTFNNGDVVTVALLQKEDENEEYKVIKEVSTTVLAEADEVQLEFNREDMHDILGEAIIEARTVTSANVEMTVQKKITLERDGIR